MKFTKSDLRTGMKVILENDDNLIVFLGVENASLLNGDYLVNKHNYEHWYRLDDFADDLTSLFNNRLNIKEVYIPKFPMEILNKHSMEDDWVLKHSEYSDVNKSKKMTIKDIENILGYKVEITS